MNRRVKKYLFDILSCISELENLVNEVQSLENLENQSVAKRAFERLFEVIGEATRNLLSEQGDIPISNTDKIIGMRNIIAHGYDLVNYRLLWQTYIEQIPILKEEITKLMEA